MIIDVRNEEVVYITIGDWIVYLDNSTNEKIITSSIDEEKK